MDNKGYRLKYGGHIEKCESHGFRHVIFINRTRHMTTFYLRDYKTLEAAKKAAEVYQKKTSDELNRTKKIKTPDNDEIPLTVRKQVSGFIDGDGCIAYAAKLPPRLTEIFGKQSEISIIICSYVGHKLYSGNSFIQVTLSQSADYGEPSILKYFQSFYGGKIYGGKRPSVSARRHWALKLNGPATDLILTHVQQHGVLKPNQARLALAINSAKKIRDKSFNFEEAGIALKTMHTFDSYANTKLETDRICAEYLASFFDAEGCIVLTRSTVIFTQKSCVRLLNAISNYFGIPSRIQSFGDLCYDGKRAVDVLQHIYPFLIVKKEQAEIAFNYRQTIGVPGLLVSNSIKRKRLELERDIKKLRHS